VRLHSKTRRYAKKQDEAVKMLGGKCVLCGVTNHLHFHHLNPDTKERNVSNFLYFKDIEVVEAELLKCVLLCSNCHAYCHGLIKRYEKAKRLYFESLREIRELNQATSLSIISE
jgi:5-methylcytosine-specific restriction endonuclease McrA